MKRRVDLNASNYRGGGGDKKTKPTGRTPILPVLHILPTFCVPYRSRRISYPIPADKVNGNRTPY